MHKIKTDTKTLKKFGLTMGIAFIVIGSIVFMKHKVFPPAFSLLSALFFVLAVLAPLALKHIYISWMKFASVLAWINTRIILCLMFYVILTPISLIMRLFGSDLLERRIDKGKDSYWKERDKKEFNREQYQRQF